MKSFKPMTNSVRAKVNSYIKNGLDISDLISDYDIQGEVFVGAIIKTIDRIGQKVTNTNFYRSVIGSEGKICNFSNSDFKGCNFSRVRFKGTVWFRHADLRNCKFNNAVLENVHYQYADIRNISLCETVMKMGSKAGYRAKANWSMFTELAQYLQIDMEK